MALRDLDIDIRLKVDTMGLDKVNSEIDKLIAKIRGIDDEKDIKLDVDTHEATLGIKRVELALQRLKEHSKIKIDIDTDFDDGAASVAMTQLRARLQALEDDVKIKIDVDIMGALANVQRLEFAMIRLKQHANIDIDIDTTAAMAQIAALQAQLLLLNGSANIGGIGGGGRVAGGLGSLVKVGATVATLVSLLPTFVGVLGTAGYAVGALTNGLLAFGSAVGVAGAGIAGAGFVAYKLIQDLYDDSKKLTETQKELKQHIDSLGYTFEVFKQAAAPQIYSTIGKGVNTIKTALTMFQPVLDDAALAVGGLFHEFNRALQGERMTAFWQYMERSVAPLTISLGRGFGYLGQSVANTMVAFEPLTQFMADGFENGMKNFADWTANVGKTDGFNDFINNTKSALSALKDIAVDGFVGVKNFFGAFEFTAVDGLEWLADKMGEFAKWSADLDNNEGFQKFLTTIKNDAPVVAGILGNLVEEIGDMYTAIDDFLRDEEGNNGLLHWFKDLQEMPKAELWGEASAPPWLESLSNMNIGSKIIEGLGVAETHIRGWIEGIGSGVSNAFSTAFSHVGGYISEVGSTIGTWFSGMGDKISSGFSSGVEALGAWFSGVGETVRGWFSGIGESISSAFSSFTNNFSIGSIDLKSLIPPLNWSNFISPLSWLSGVVSSLDWSRFIPSLSWASGIISNINWSSFISALPWGNFIKSISWSSFVSSLSWSNFVKSFSWASFINPLSWVNFVKSLSWSSFVKSLGWGNFVRSLSWSSFVQGVNLKSFVPKFPSWSSLVGNVGGIVKGAVAKLGFSTGLGRVPQDMDVTVHKDEAIIQASEAQRLRELGIIDGDGRYPKVNPTAANNTTNNSNSVSTTTTYARNDSGTVVYVGGISITLPNGGGGGYDTSSLNDAVTTALERAFGNLVEVLPT